LRYPQSRLMGKTGTKNIKLERGEEQKEYRKT
jgi:hypothetical protein